MNEGQAWSQLCTTLAMSCVPDHVQKKACLFIYVDSASRLCCIWKHVQVWAVLCTGLFSCDVGSAHHCIFILDERQKHIKTGTSEICQKHLG
jgi:hypothetical protein